MPYPMEYRHASEDFDRFLADLVDESGLATRNQAYTTAQAVLQCFRRRLSPDEAICFAQTLPAVLRALFIADWDPFGPIETSWDRDVMNREVKELRRDHNFSNDSSIGDVAAVLRKHVDRSAFDACIRRMRAEAAAFWS